MKNLLFILPLFISAYASAANLTFTRGYESDTERPNTNKWSDINNWAASSVDTGGTAPGYYNTADTQATAVPAAGDTVKLWMNSGIVSDAVLDLDTDGTVGYFIFSNRSSPINTITASNSSKLYIDMATPGKSGGIRKERNLSDSTINADIVFNYRINDTTSQKTTYKLSNNSDRDLIFNGTITTNVSEGTLGTYDRLLSIQVEARNKGTWDAARGGNIVLNSFITTNKQIAITRTTPTTSAPYVGRVIFSGSKTNSLSGLTLSNGVQVDFAMTNGATALSGSGAIEISTGGKLYLGVNEQLSNSTSLQFKTADSDGYGGYFYMGGTVDQVAAGTDTGFSEKLGSMYLSADSTSKSTYGLIDYGVNDTAQYFTFTGFTYSSSTDVTKSGFKITNYDIATDKFYCTSKLDDTKISMIYFVDFGEKGTDYEILERTQVVDSSTVYEYYVNVIPEPSTVATLIGICALALAFRRRI